MSTAAKAFLTDLQTARIERILAATLKLIGEVGAERMTMRDVARLSEVSAATLYNRFGTKDHLITLAVVSNFERSIQAVVDAHAKGKTPLQKIVFGLEVLAHDILLAQQFAHALVGAFFKLDNDREMPNQLFDAIRATWQPAVEEMQARRSLREWVSAPLLIDEISDRTLCVVMRWAQDAFPRKELKNRLVISVVNDVLAASRGKQAVEAEQLLRKLIGNIRLGTRDT